MSNNYGTTPELIRSMFAKGKVRYWSYAPLMAGFAFSISTVALRAHPRLRTAAQVSSGAFLVFGSHFFAADGMINEKVGNTSNNINDCI